MIGALVGWILSLVEDDVLGVVTSHLWLHNFTMSYYGKQGLVSGFHPTQKGITRTLHFHNQGNYEVTGGWRLINPA